MYEYQNNEEVLLILVGLDKHDFISQMVLVIIGPTYEAFDLSKCICENHADISNYYDIN